ncbi:hypothetical protein QE152_g7336 [Popillia japonica]|uniref:Reverse transcriptase Ty1/copia-type domain-containing protein n=1 Tax=Popillia japonica TaxID=7064 RepID=A0AAW1MFW0_POPJA
MAEKEVSNLTKLDGQNFAMWKFGYLKKCFQITIESTAAIDKILQYLKKCFQITIDDANLFVGLELARNKSAHQILIKQTAYIKKIITKFKMEDAKPSAIPMDPGKQLHRPKEEEKLEGIPYREAIGALLFVARLTRPDIEFAVNRLSQFLTC